MIDEVGTKYCQHCGQQIQSSNRYCPHCGYDTATPLDTMSNNAYGGVNADAYNSMVYAGFIVQIIFTVIFGLFLIPLAWNIPLCIHVYNQMKERKPINLGAAIAILILNNIISGVFYLIDYDAKVNHTNN